MKISEILEKLHLIAKEATKENIEFETFKEDLLKQIKAEKSEKQAYLEIILGYAERDNSILGKSSGGKFVFSESILKLAEKEIVLKRNDGIDKKRETEYAGMKLTPEKINEMIDLFSELTAKEKMQLFDAIKDMTEQQYSDYTEVIKKDFDRTEKLGKITKKENKALKLRMYRHGIFVRGTEEEKRHLALVIKAEKGDEDARKAIKEIGVENLAESVRKAIPNEGLFKYVTENDNIANGKKLDRGSIIDNKSKEELINTTPTAVDFNENDENLNIVSLYINDTKKIMDHYWKGDIEKVRESISVETQMYEDTFGELVLEATSDEGSEFVMDDLTETDIEELEKKPDGILMDFTSLYKLTEISSNPIADKEFAEAFGVTEIAMTKTEEPKTVDTALEEEPGMGEGSGLPSSITIEKINSDAVSPVRKDDKLETKSVIKFAETFVKSSSYLKKMKDVKEFAHAGIDNNKSTEIGDIA